MNDRRPNRADRPGAFTATGIDDPVARAEYGDDPEGVPDDRPPEDVESRARTDGDTPDDPMPAHLRTKAERLAEPGLLTRQQALAYVLRDVAGWNREETADALGVSENVHDDHIAAARRKIRQVDATASVLELIETGDE